MEITTSTAEIKYDDMHLYFNVFLVAKFNQSCCSAISLFKDWLETTASGWKLEAEIERLEGTIDDLYSALQEYHDKEAENVAMTEGDL